ncbi:MAG: hypothetical protein P8H90_09735 [Tateyamaria sp.]|jgi:hypothetical protein|nr:hypothetical protein [Tateyamaria sp.]MDG1679419.1 hypothetical protein [Tateyamaria sp.]MDG2377423.1 hypothetical protein [Tateyamaria sp.]
MRVIAQRSHQVAANVIVVLAFIDDMQTTEGRLSAKAYKALEN